MDLDDVTIREQNFHSQVREYIICFLLFTILYTISNFIITKYKRKPDDHEDEDAIVNRISLYLCTFTLAVSAGSVLLLPFSIISNEILLSLPQNYYIQWLNGSLIHGLWNLASLFSNLSLFVLMPFAYFFLESEGFAGSKKEKGHFDYHSSERTFCWKHLDKNFGIRARILETVVMLILLGLLILGIVWVASALIDNDAASMESLYDLWEFYLPYLYSCISLMGGLLLLLCTPVGLSRMFTVMGQLLVKPTILEDLDEQIYCIDLQEEALIRRLNGAYMTSNLKYNSEDLEQELDGVRTKKLKLERRKKASAWERNLVYPVVMLILLSGTAISVLLVAFNILTLLVDESAMPKGSQIIGNCVSILVLSSALPVMSRTLGITRFDLLGDFGRFNWLGNFYIVLSYNLLFAVVTTLCLIRKFTSAVREELLKALELKTQRRSCTLQTDIKSHSEMRNLATSRQLCVYKGGRGNNQFSCMTFHSTYLES
ncbi:limb region 1 protein homolog isoform X9 [Narcine bancroftii]|uniref:limb region 1 protein homolog isoform X9 n=1 Tax=Narcine bancroftii TaxID=1343680 RepID=UPI0038311F38